MNLDLQKIAQVTCGRLAPANARAAVTGISTDSRSVRPGELFVPLRGEKFDGHDFLAQAVRRGAAACLSEEVIAGFPVPVIQVADTLRALGDLAAACRRDFGGPVVAVTGSSGKTTTKEMLASILAETAPGLKTEGNFNNLVGLPLTLFRLEPEHRWAVLEMGMSARGEIARLAEIAVPDVGVITNIGPAHLETLHGLDGVARAKGELFAALKAGGTAVINADDARVAQLPVANGVRRLLYGFAPEAEIRAEEVAVTGATVSFRLLLASGAWPVRLAVAGRHNVCNALAAAAAAVALAVSPEAIVRGLQAFRGGHGRMEVVDLGHGTVLIEDTYNANPLSVRAALMALDEMGGSGRRIAVLGDMLELGAEAVNLHRQVGAAAAQHCDLLLLLGAMAAETAAGARQQGLPADRIKIVASHAEAVERLRALLQPGDRLLVKGSRGMQMEKVAAALRGSDNSLAAGNG
jgi:UDP-N-acetylmuramoyl-tripeptide--D-alanyl-D-alanine ligase